MIESNQTSLEQVEYEKEIVALREKLDVSDFEQAWEAGQKLSMDQAIALAVQER